MDKHIDRCCLLDFDGVMTSCFPGGGSYITNPPSKYGYSEECFANLMQLLQAVDAKVVISSNWRRYKPDGGWEHRTAFTAGRYINPLPKFVNDLGDKVIGTLPTDRYITKSEALILWLEGLESIPDFVIFDDDLREGFQSTSDYGICRKFILTDPKLGLTKADVRKAISMFKEQEIRKH